MFNSTQNAKSLVAVAAVVLLAVPAAQAALTDLGNGTVQDSSLNVVWTQDANLFKTLAASTPGLVGTVISTVNGQVTDSSGTYFLNGAEFDTDSGKLSWYGAQAWTSYLNSIGYAGHHNWSLPRLVPVSGSDFDTAFSYDGSTDVGYNAAGANTALGHLFHVELSNNGFYSRTGVEQSPYGAVNTAPFTNLLSAVYWTGAEQGAGEAFYFSTLDGLQGSFDKTQLYNVIAVAPVPVPMAFWLFGSAMTACSIVARKSAVAGTRPGA